MEHKDILALIENFHLWKGDVYRLAVLVSEGSKEAIKTKLETAGHTEAAELI
jgi:hypothetical protein